MHCFPLKNSPTPASLSFFNFFVLIVGFVDLSKLSVAVYQVHHAFVKLAVPKNRILVVF